MAMDDPNLLILEDAAAKLRALLDRVVFVGGSTLGLLITDTGAAQVRATIDVDVIAEISTPMEYFDFSERLKEYGFMEDSRPGAPTCRWVHGTLILDVMPIEKGVLGPSNRWYKDALRSAQSVLLPSGVSIRVITAPYFLGTKIEAFRGRGNRDFFGSHDLEDFVAVIDGRKAILQELASVPAELRRYLAAAAGELLAEPRFLDALPGYLLPDEISQQRISGVLDKLTEISK
jgi:hypothetical protein